MRRMRRKFHYLTPEEFRDQQNCTANDSTTSSVEKKRKKYEKFPETTADSVTQFYINSADAHDLSTTEIHARPKDQPTFSINFGQATQKLGSNYGLVQLRAEPQKVAEEVFRKRNVGNKLLKAGETFKIKTYSEIYEELGSHILTRDALRKQKKQEIEYKEHEQYCNELRESVKRFQREQGARKATFGPYKWEPSYLDRKETCAEQEESFQVSEKKQNGLQTNIKRCLRKSYFTGKLEVLNIKLVPRDISCLVKSSLSLQLCNLEVVRIVNNELEYIPDKLFETLRFMHTLEISQNKVDKLPDDIIKLSSLRHLNVQYNRIYRMEDVISKMKFLEELLIGGNGLQRLAKTIGHMKSLKKLSLENNDITDLPWTFYQMRNLQFLNFNNNRLNTLAMFKVESLDEAFDECIEWEEVKDPMTGDIAFMNKKTMEIRRNIILEDKDTNDIDEENDLNPSLVGLAAQLEDGWEEIFDDKTSQPCYFNSATGEIRWEKPLKIIDIGASLKLDLSTVKRGELKIQKKMKELKQRRMLAKEGKCVWSHFINSETGVAEFKNEITGKIVNIMPRELDHFGKLRGLETLLLNCNDLTELPPSIGQCTNLERLDVSFNRIAFIPDTISKLVRLRFFAMNENNLENIPVNIGSLVKLRELRVDGNKLTELPKSIGDCYSLEVLTATGNQMKTLTETVGKLENLKTISIFDNPLVSPSKDVLEQGLKAILWDCRERAKRLRVGMPPKPRKQRNVGMNGERQVTQQAFEKDMQQAISVAKETGSLQLHFLGLRKIPAEYLKLKTLRELRIAGNELREIPEQIGRLVNLEILHLTGSGLTSLPETIWTELKKLRELDVSENQIRNIPESLFGIKTMTSLIFSGNSLNEIPELIGSLLNMEHLRLENNHLDFLPDGLCKLSKLKSLFVTKNKLKYLPKDFGQLTLLKKLHISDNRLLEFPDSMHQLRNLEVLHASHNCLESFKESFFSKYMAKSLTFLNVQANKLVEISMSFKAFTSLKVFIFDMNPLRSPPKSLRNEAWEVDKVLEYLAERHRRFELIKRLSVNAKVPATLNLENLSPKTSRALLDKEQYLKKRDHAKFDRDIDHLINADFYNYEKPAQEIFSDLEEIYERRRQEFYRRVLDELMNLLEIANARCLFPSHCYNTTTEMPFGRKSEKVLCYAFKIGALFEPINPIIPADKKQNTTIKKHPSNTQSEEQDGQLGEESVAVKVVEDDDDSEEDSLLSLSSDENFASDTESESSVDTEYGIHDIWPAVIESVYKRSGFKFRYSLENLELALRGYQGPYGRVSWYKAPFRFDGETDKALLTPEEFENKLLDDEIKKALGEMSEKDKKNRVEKIINRVQAYFPEAKRQAKLHAERLKRKLIEKIRVYPEMNDGRNVVIIAQLLYTEEESWQREIEEMELKKRIDKEIKQLGLWLKSKEGSKRLKSAVMRRTTNVLDNLEVVTDDYDLCKKQLKKKEDILETSQQRKEAYEQGKPYDSHRLLSEKQCREMMNEATEKEKEASSKFAEAEKELKRLKAARKKSNRWWRKDTIRVLNEELTRRTTEAFLEIMRKRAMDLDERRPWDGVHGKDFIVWKLERQREAIDAGDDDSVETSSTATSISSSSEMSNTELEKQQKENDMTKLFNTTKTAESGESSKEELYEDLFDQFEDEI